MKRRAHDEQAWRRAKKICRLNTRQVEMARALGMNPEKLPGLRPSPEQRWKAPVGEFIEDRYWKRFGGNSFDPPPHVAALGWRKPSGPQREAHVPERVRDAAGQAGDLVCYLMNLADDLQKWLAQGTIASEVLPQVIEELRRIAEVLNTGAPISPIPAIPLPPCTTRHAVSQRADQERTFDNEIPF